MLSMKSNFTDMDIEDVQVLRSATVYKLSGFAGESIVIKCEPVNVAASSLKHAKVAMKAVDRRGAGNVKELSTSERQALKDYVEFMKRVTQDFSENKVANFAAGRGTQDLGNVVSSPLWYKMPLVDMTDADKMLLDRLGVESGVANKGVMSQFCDGLKAPGGLEQIGKIVAADMYISNADRFSPLEGSKRQYGKKELKFKCVMNIGNIFVIGKKTQQRIAFSGHDFIDPNSQYRNFDMSLQEVKEYADADWLGKHVCDGKLRKTFAKHIVSDLEIILTPNRKASSPFRKLGKDAVKRVERGMLAGMGDIVREVDRKYANNPPMPKGVQGRRDLFKAAVG